MPRTTDVADKVSRLRQFMTREHRMPGYNEMLQVFGYKSKNAVFGLLHRLEQLGYVTKKSGKLAYTGKLTGTVRLLGTVEAGFPSPAEEDPIDTLSLDEFLVDRPDDTFMLTVHGDSMQGAGIHSGDRVLVERGRTPRPNDIVIAQVDGEWTMKYLGRDSQGVKLEAANPNYPTIRPKRSLEIAGVVRTVIRKLA